MPDKQLTHKSIATRIKDYDIVQAIAEQLSAEMGLSISMADAIHFIAEYWQQNRGKNGKV
jgi:hypothetical protein